MKDQPKSYRFHTYKGELVWLNGRGNRLMIEYKDGWSENFNYYPYEMDDFKECGRDMPFMWMKKQPEYVPFVIDRP